MNGKKEEQVDRQTDRQSKQRLTEYIDKGIN